MMAAGRGKAPTGGNRSRPWEKSRRATCQAYRPEADALDRVRVCAAGIVYYAKVLEAGGQWRDFDALLRLLDAIRAEAARLYDGRRERWGGRP